MIICHCQHITDTDIETAIDWMRAADPLTIVTPRKVYRALGKAADCGGCMPLFLDTMRKSDKFEVPVLRSGQHQPANAKEQDPCKAIQKLSST